MSSPEDAGPPSSHATPASPKHETTSDRNVGATGTHPALVKVQPPKAYVGPHTPEVEHTQHHQSPWFWVMCLTGVDYFSTLAYQPFIAFEAAGKLGPYATFVLVLLTLFGALPVYCHVASKSPHGQGSIAMLERLMHGWNGKTLVLILLGFAATDFVITKTLSAADAAVHLIDNHYWETYIPDWLENWGNDGQRMAITVLLLISLGAMFLRGFKEVIGIAVVIVGVFLTLNAVIIAIGVHHLGTHPSAFADWQADVAEGRWHIMHNPLEGMGHNVWVMAGVCLLIFPKLALGLSGFETGVAVMPMIQGDPDDEHQQPRGRIRSTKKLLIVAAAVMSVYLLGSSIITATLIPPQHMVIVESEKLEAMTPAEIETLRIDQKLDGQILAEALAENQDYRGPAVERTLAFIAHGEGGMAELCPWLFGEIFGTIYDLSTIAILSFAGASAMAGLLNLVPQYLPRYGMAPGWASATRPLVILFTFINLFVTWIFNADVTAQSGAYATGVLVLISSASLATVIDKWHAHHDQGFLRWPWGYAVITGVFFYTTAANMVERPDGIFIASFFIVAILLSSFWSRLRRSTELRFRGFEFADAESRFMWDALKHLEFPVLVPHRPGARDLAEKDAIIRERHRLGPDVPIVFIEAELGDPSEFQMQPLMSIREEEGRFVIGVQRCVSIAHVIAIIALECSKVGIAPEIHFGWSNESPMAASVGFLLFGEGNVPWMVHELIRKAEPDPTRQPQVFIG